MSHLTRALEILEGAIAHSDFDERMGRLYVNVLEDALFLARATSNQTYASDVLKRYNDARRAVTIPGFQRFSFESLSQALGSDPWISEAVADAIGRPSSNQRINVPILTAGTEEARHRGRIKTPLNQNFGFIVSRGQEWFFHRSDLLSAAEWQQLVAGSLVTFQEGRDPKGRMKEVNIRIE